MKCPLALYTWLLRIIILAYAIYLLFIPDRFPIAFIILGMLSISFIAFFRKQHTVDILCTSELLYLLLLIFHILGTEKLYVYAAFSNSLHFFMGMLIALIFAVIFFTVFQKNNLKMNPIIIAILSLTSTITLGVFWEFFEFTWDLLIVPHFPHLRAQLGLTDTMVDLLLDTLGAMIGILLFYLLKKTKVKKFLTLHEKTV